MIKIFNTWIEPTSPKVNKYTRVIATLHGFIHQKFLFIKVNDYVTHRNEFMQSPHYEILIKCKMWDYGEQQTYAFVWLIDLNRWDDIFFRDLIIKEMEVDFANRLKLAYETKKP